jgi:hypothetical protein
MTKGEIMSENEVYNDLIKTIEKWGSQKAFAQVCGISKSYMSDVVRKKRPLPEKVLSKLGVRSRIVYEPYEDFAQ